MFLFSKNKIISYINEHPESRVSLMLLLKSYYLRKASSFYGVMVDDYNISNRNGSSSFSNDYNVLFEINSHAKAELITWVGSNLELEEKRRIDHEKIERYCREVLGQTLVTKTHASVIKGSLIKQPKQDISVPTHSSELEDKIKTFNLNVKISELEFFTTIDEYELGLETAVALFDSRPGSSDFDSLLLLLFKIDHYERNDLVFPEVTIIECILHNMKIFKLDLSHFRNILEENDFKLFLAGELKLKAYTLNRILTRLGLKFLKKKAKKR